MSGPEAFAILGLIGSIISIIDGTKQVYDAATNAHGLPEAFREVAGRLPLVESILRSAEQQIQRGAENENDWVGVNEIIKACKMKAERLKDLFEKAIPVQDTHNFRRFYQAYGIYSKGNQVKELMQGILQDLQLLTCHRSMRAATQAEQAQILQFQATAEVSAVGSSVPGATSQRVTDIEGRSALHYVNDTVKVLLFSQISFPS